VLGYAGPAEGGERWTLSREKHVQVGGKFADAALGDFRLAGANKFIVAVEGKGPKDPLDRPFAGRQMSAVDQAYRYAINLPCDWILVTSIRQTRLYYKGSDQQTYERFDTVQLAVDDAQLKKFVFLLGAARMVPPADTATCTTCKPLRRKSARKLTKEYYLRYANMRQDAFENCAGRMPMYRRRRSCIARKSFWTHSVLRLLRRPRLAAGRDHQESLCPPRPYNPRPIWENFRGLFQSITSAMKR